MTSSRAIILAAGFGSRLRPLTDDRPKCLVELAGRPLLARQRDTLHACGIDDVTIVAGHLAEMLALPGLHHVQNPDYATTNMVSSLMCARNLFDGVRDIVIVYGDIVFEVPVLETVLRSDHDIAVAIDRGWFDLWSLRMDDPLSDAESLKIAPDGRIAELGKKATRIDEIEGQYIGLIKIKAGIQKEILQIYDGLDPSGPYLGKDKANMFMTTFIQLLIDRKLDVGPAFIRHGWLEVDSTDDLAAYETAYRSGALKALYDAG